jgi:hypothetical protein
MIDTEPIEVDALNLVEEPETESARKLRMSKEEKYEQRLNQLRELVESHADAVCEYCIPVTDEPIMRHDLEPAVAGRHRVIHTLAYEGEKWVPCRCNTVQAETATGGNSIWHTRYASTAPAKL